MCSTPLSSGLVSSHVSSLPHPSVSAASNAQVCLRSQVESLRSEEARHQQTFRASGSIKQNVSTRFALFY